MLPTIPNKSHIEQQLTSILKQQQPNDQHQQQQQPVEFIIETKIKTIDPKTGQILQTSSTDSNMMPLTSSYNQTNKKVQHLDEGKSYFMKSFHQQQQQQQHSPPQREKSKHKKNQHRSSRIKIPLLNLNSSTFTDNDAPNMHTPLPLLLDFKSTSKKQKSSSSPPPLLNLLSDGVNQKLNKHVKEFISVNKSSAHANYKQFPLLKLNFNEGGRRENDLERSSTLINGGIQEIITQPPPPPAPAPAPPPQPVVPLPAAVETKSQEVQVQKPMYDGYILAPGAFDELLDNANERLSATNAQAHYNSTQHIRDQQEQSSSNNKRKKSACTMTTPDINVAPLPPDILFKLKFDPKRKDRATNDDGNDEREKDFVNVADLDGNAVDDLLKLIEREQIKRQQPKPSDIIMAKNRSKALVREEQEETLLKNDTSSKTDLDLEPTRGGGDVLTNELLLLERSREEWREYDAVMQRQIDEATQRAAKSVAKRKHLNELEFMDEKIKLINEMASQMSSDYSKYNEALSVVQEFGREREEMARIQQRQDDEERRRARMYEEKLREAKERKETNDTFYERQEADAQVKDLKKRVDSRQKKPQIMPRKPTTPKNISE